MGIELELGEGTAVPRRETEAVARAAIAWLGRARGREDPWVVDVCCGSGNLACAIALAVPDARVWACDLREDAVRCARANVVRLGLGDRVIVERGDLFEPLADAGVRAGVEAIVGSPPCTASALLDGPERARLLHEPREALDAGPLGIRFHERILSEGVELLRPGGRLFLQIAPGQGPQARALVHRHPRWVWLGLATDPAGRARVAMLRRSAVDGGAWGSAEP
jgi:release factor glutamine methyltransferase